MWTVFALVVLAPIVWALLGAEPIPALDPWLAEHVTGWLTTPVVVSTATLIVAMGAGVILGVGRGRATTSHLSTLAHEFGHA
jgi:hypothetical protein